MGILSYAQNFEDVLLWRALGHIEHGCYIDIGAHDPVIDSVSKAFYERGWRGIHVEPLPVYCDALRKDRPDETVLQAAVAAETGLLRFYEIPNTGISTGEESIAQSHRERGFPINEITVPCVTLDQVFQQVRGNVVHWLKIDVEGLEEQVLRGWGQSKLRPWVVVIESTLPLTQDEAFGVWEGLLTKKGYRFVHFDGLNRYYLAKGHKELESAFNSGPNVFDGFQLNGTANNPFCGHVVQSLNNQLGSQIELLKQQVEQHQAKEHEIANNLADEHNRTDALVQTLRAEQIVSLQNQNETKLLAMEIGQKARQEIETQLRTVIQREQEFNAQLLAGRDQLQQLEQAHNHREKQLQKQLAEVEQQARLEVEAELRKATQREQEFNAQLLAERVQLQQLDQARNSREKQLQKQLTEVEQQARQEIETQLRTVIQREQEFNAQLLAGRDQLLLLEKAHSGRENQLQKQLAQVEQQARLEIEAQLRTATQREQEFNAQVLSGRDQLQLLEQKYTINKDLLLKKLAQAEQQIKEITAGRLQQAIQREQEFNAQLLAGSDQLLQLEQAHRGREKQLQNQLAEVELQARLTIEAELRKATQREQEFNAQLQAGRDQLQQLEQTHSNREKLLQNQLVEVELEARLTIEAELRKATQREQEFNTQLQAGKADFLQLQLEHGVSEKRLVEAHAALVAQLKAEIASGQNSKQELQQRLAEVQHSLARMHASMSWRLTAPFRAVFFYFLPKKSVLTPIYSNQDITKQDNPPFRAINSTPVIIPSHLPGPNMFFNSENYPSMPVTTASTLDELMAFHDQPFVTCSYQTLLGRAPDLEGLNYYLGRLRTGIPKIQLLSQLYLSEEGKNFSSKLPGLENAIKRHQRGCYPLIGWLFRIYDGAEGNHPTERKLRGIENQIFSLSHQCNHRFDQLDAAISDLHHLIQNNTKFFVDDLGHIPNNNLCSVPNSHNQTPEHEGLKQLSPRARDIFLKLKSAAAEHARRAA
jgi:FkbM family methyltransferase